MKVICQECGKELDNTGFIHHDYNDCGRYHLKRAEEILGFNLTLLTNENSSLSERLFAEQSDVLESDAKMTKITETVKRMAELVTCAPVPTDEAINILSKDVEELCGIIKISFVTEDTKTPENPQNVCPAKSCHVNGTVPLSGDSPDAKGREMSCVEKEKGEQK
jgi:hypothetical protein